MTAHTAIADPKQMDKLAKTASALGFEIVDIASFLDLLEGQATQQREALKALTQSSEDMRRANGDSMNILASLAQTSDQTRQDVQTSVALVRNVGEQTRDVAAWVRAVGARTDMVGETLRAVTANNSEIASIAAQVNTLAINAKIEAARAGDAGRGFAVVADAINDLSQKTGTAAQQISQNIETLTSWIKELGHEAGDVAEKAAEVMDKSNQSDQALGRMEMTVRSEHEQSQQITEQIKRVEQAVSQLRPAVEEIDTTVRATSDGITNAHHRVENLIETSEMIVQLTAALGGVSVDAPFIRFAQGTARKISEGLEQALELGQITMDVLFDRQYVPIPGSNPPQVMTRAVEFLDRFLPQFQEPALEFDPRVVFCAAVDTNGYLPTHNRKFSQPQSADVVWNTANARNRRIFDDRVGLKAGKSTAPFLLQVYRRDMGGGAFKVMKDLSAPIMVRGRHWGGLRLAYSY